MARYYLLKEQISASQALLPPSENHHLQRVLRKKPGDEILAADGSGSEYRLKILRFDDAEGCLCEILERRQPPPDLWKIELWIPLLKQNRHLWIAEKAAEIGAATIIPYISERVIIRKNFEKHQQKLENAVQAAAKQCGATVFPHVLPVKPLGQYLQKSDAATLKICAWESEESGNLFQFSQLQSQNPLKIALLTGPEGGFSASEAENIHQSGFQLIRLGHRILRAETAAIFLLSAIQTLQMQAERNL